MEKKKLTLNELANRCHEDAKSLGWYESDKKRSDLESLMMIVTELSEVVEELRNDKPEMYYISKIAGERTLLPNEVNRDRPDFTSIKPEGWGVELADAMIRLLDFAASKNLDMEYLINEKLNYNLTRGYRHGNKKY